MQSKDQKSDLKAIFDGRTKSWKSLDYVSGWFMKSADYGRYTNSATAFVSTNSICQGRQAPTLWPVIFDTGHEISFAHTSFKWANLASYNAGVTVVIVGISNHAGTEKKLFSQDDEGYTIANEVKNLNAYLVASSNISISSASKPNSEISPMSFGNMPNEGGFLLLDQRESEIAISQHQVNPKFIRNFYGSQELIRGTPRKCIWISEKDLPEAESTPWLLERFKSVSSVRLNSARPTTKSLAKYSYRFGEVRQKGSETVLIVPSVSSESREYLPVGYEPSGTIVSNLAFALYDAPLWNMALIASRIHLVWIATVCGKLETRYRYSNTLGWNTFPVPELTEKNKEDLTRCAEDILLAREAHFPATIADLYKPEAMPENLRQAHDRNDETLERIYLGRRFKNDTERLEKLFELYTKMTA
jgi:hypothetical protein